ncbi:hypothetical protein H671_6g16123 [Cricetulus griseus]|nr:hypothetical protein H671_6g16123 [Cricetulus griseus]
MVTHNHESPGDPTGMVIAILMEGHPLVMVQDTVLGNTTHQGTVGLPLPMDQGTVGLPLPMDQGTVVHITEESEEKRTQDEESA